MRAVAAAVAVAVALALAGCSLGVSDDEEARVTAAAEAAYAKARAEGRDLSSGPCLADPVPGMSDWVVDVAHDPREPVDDEPENQCSAYRSGDAEHFIEISPGGDVIRVE